MKRIVSLEPNSKRKDGNIGYSIPGWLYDHI